MYKCKYLISFIYALTFKLYLTIFTRFKFLFFKLANKMMVIINDFCDLSFSGFWQSGGR